MQKLTRIISTTASIATLADSDRGAVRVTSPSTGLTFAQQTAKGGGDGCQGGEVGGRQDVRFVRITGDGSQFVVVVLISNAHLWTIIRTHTHTSLFR